MIPFAFNRTNIVSGLVMDYDAVQAVYFHQAQALPLLKWRNNKNVLNGMCTLFVTKV